VAVFNRRNAAVGWLTLFVGKRVLKRKAKQAVPAIDTESKRPNKSAIALLVASAAGALTFWRRRSGDEETD
jgi:MYXO-CTERM domain-containing protein